MIFFCGLIGFWLSKLFNRFHFLCWPVLLLSLIGLFLPDLSPWLGLDDLADHLFYYILGMTFSRQFVRESLPGKLKSYLIAFALFVVSVILFRLSITFPISAYTSPIIACGMIAACALALLPISLRTSLRRDSLLNRSYSVFILSWPCQLVVELILERLLGLPFLCIMPCMFTVGILLPSLLILLIDRIERNMKYKIISWIVGG